MLKTIKINLPFFKTKNKTIKRIKTTIDMSQLKEKLQNNIQNRKTNSIKISNPIDINHQTEFTNSVQFMDKKVDTHKSKSKVTIKSQLPITNQIKTHTTFENIIENPDMSTNTNINTLTNYKIYDDISIPGCLKNGKKKTYKAFTNKPLSKHQRVSFTQNPLTSVQSNITTNTQNVMTLQNNNTYSDINAPLSNIQTYTEPIPTQGGSIPTLITNDIIDLSNIDGNQTNMTIDMNADEMIKTSKDIKYIDLPEIHLESNNPENTTPTTTNNKDLEEISTNEPSIVYIMEPQPNSNISNEPQITKIIKKTIKKYKLGKNVTRKIVSVLCKNKDSIQNIKKYTQEICDTNLNQMKQYLINNTLLSVGSYAPNNVITQMYVNAKLTGDIVNHNDNLLLNNFITDSNNNLYP